MRLLDLFCGAGGAAMGYRQAGFTDIVGIDTAPQPHYPFTFVQADALDYVAEHGAAFDAIHASPPCQAYSRISSHTHKYPDLYAPTREALRAIARPWVIENVIGAPYRHGIVLCGSMFALRVQRHRNFETSFLILHSLVCQHGTTGRPVTITGTSDTGGKEYKHSFKGNKADWPRYMQMPWATPRECTQAIPPAYTRFIGAQLLTYLE